MNSLKAIFVSRELLFNLTLREIRGKFKRTIFGQLWSLANPIASMLVYTVVFALIIKVQPAPGNPSGMNFYALWLLCALLPWNFFVAVIMGGMGSILGNSDLIKKVHFPRSTLVLSQVLSASYTWCIEMVVLLVALSLFGAFVVPWIPLLVVFMFLLVLFAAGVALVLAIANVHFRDTQYLVGILLQMWFYLTPILYPVAKVAEVSQRNGGQLGTNITILDIYRLNPMERFSAVFRNLLYDNRLPEVDDVFWCIGWALIALVLGFYVFQRSEKKLAELL